MQLRSSLIMTSGRNTEPAKQSIAAKARARNYEVVKELGRGAAGVAYLVREMHNEQRLFVAKEIEQPVAGASGAHEPINAAEMDALRTMFHPHILTLYDAWYGGGSVVLLTNYCEHGDLETMLKPDAVLPCTTIMAILAQLALALDLIHSRHVMHRDVKPENIFLDKCELGGQLLLRLGDFGICKHLQRTEQSATTTTGTPLFVSPELVSGGGYNRRTDVWSLGVVMYRCMTSAQKLHTRWKS